MMIGQEVRNTPRALHVQPQTLEIRRARTSLFVTVETRPLHTEDAAQETCQKISWY